MITWAPRSVPADVADRYVRTGAWTDDALGAVLAGGLAAAGGHPFTVTSAARPWRGTFAEVADLARRVAGGLRSLGIGPGDPVAFQLPNWLEAAAVFYGAAMLGAVVVPIVHFYAAREVAHILRDTGARVLVTADRFGAVDFLANLEAIGPQPALEAVVVVGDDAGRHRPFRSLLDADPVAAPAPVDPSSPALVAYTSGTTADAKGVVHTHRTIGAEIRQLGAIQAPGPAFLVGAPVGHAIGMLSALLLPVHRRTEIHLLDVWDPGTVLAEMLARRLSAGQGATFFLTSLLDHPDFDPQRHAPLMPHIGLGGAAVPEAVGERAERLGITTMRNFGCTEHPSVTGSRPDAPRRQRIATDGRALPGVELRIVDGIDVGPGRAGEILSRGPDLAMGYTDADRTAEAFDGDGWYATGDIGVIDEDGCLTITDRKKDIIIRGGENISAAELEELLVRLPGVAECAVVAAPDPRLGEHACAFLRLRPGAEPPDLTSVRAHLAAAGLARQKWPEELRTLDELPRTPSGKVQKFVLRDRLRAESRPPL